MLCVCVSRRRVFGRKDEVFKYRMMGTHPTMSGACAPVAAARRSAMRSP
jgi:hypothetical protein